MSLNLDLIYSDFNLTMNKSNHYKIYVFERFRLDAGHLMLYGDAEEIPLPPKAVETLLVLVERRGEILSKDELMSTIWADSLVEESNLAKYLHILRNTLGDQQNGKPFIETLRRRGYRFVGDVRLEPANNADNRTPVSPLVVESGESLHNASAISRSLSDVPQTANRTEIPPQPLGWSWTSRRVLLASASVIAVVAILAFTYAYFFSRRSIHSIAVMPFANQSGDPKLEYLSDGLTGNLIESISKVSGLEVKAQSTVVRYKGANSDARRIGQELNVEAVLFANLIETGEDLTLQVELVDSRNGNNLWRRTYQKKESGLVVLQSELARDLVRELSVPITDKTQEKLAKRDTENSDAMRLYLKGVIQARKLTEQDIREAIDLFSQAITKDPEFARAYAAMSSARRSLTLCCDGRPSELLQAELAAKKAVDLDDELAEAHSALAAVIYMYDWNWAEAEKEFQRALELDSNSSISHFQYGDFLGRMGRRQESNVEGERARELEPFSPFFNAFGANKEPEKAVERIRFAIDLDHNFYFSHSMAAGIYGQRKMYDKAIEEARLSKKLSPDQTWSDVILSSIYVNAGKPEEARAILDRLLLRSKSRYVPPSHIALIYNYLGDKEQAFYWLENAYDIHDSKMTTLKNPWWKNIENEPRFQDLKRRVGFVDAK